MNIIFVSPKDDVTEMLRGISQPTTVYFAEGVYEQKIFIAGDDITLVGANRETTVITYGDYARKIHADGQEYNTFRTYTLCVAGKNVRMKNITVVNSNTDPAKVGQCVALSVHAKNFKGENLKLVSTQDTLFLSPFPDDLVTRYRGFIPRDQLYTEGGNLHVFEKCEISGTVDFIFGGAEAYFNDCDIISLHDSRGYGFVAAPCHCLAEARGFTFYNCRIKSGGAENGSVYLARPWRDYGKCVFVNCSVGCHISPLLFDKWNDTDRDKSARFLFGGLHCDGACTPVPWAVELDKNQQKAVADRVKQILSE